VFTGPGLSQAVHFWYLKMPRDLPRCISLHAHRLAGFRSRRRYALALSGVCAHVSLGLAKHALGRSRPAPVKVGPTSYN
jgi:hypothetical protein